MYIIFFCLLRNVGKEGIVINKDSNTYISYTSLLLAVELFIIFSCFNSSKFAFTIHNLI